MKATLRFSAAAAAMLLAPIAALLVAQPAAAQQDHDRWEHRDSRQRRDDRAPVVSDLTPSQGERVGARGLTRISAHFDDQGSGVDRRSVMLRIDGRDVTRRARVDSDDIRYADDLRPGRHMAELVVRDRAGNTARRSWTFEVLDRGRDVGYHNAR
jgi:Ni/Co efflux regulator RcnB